MLDAQRLRSILDYAPLTGAFFWRVDKGRAKRGQRAGSRLTIGYRHIGIDGTRYYEHHLAWLYMTGQWSEQEIDHEDLDRSNNRWTNLRQATSSQNKMNIGLRRDNTVGAKGIHPTRSGTFCVQIWCDGKCHNKNFKNFEDAKQYRELAVRRLHGNFARSS